MLYRSEKATTLGEAAREALASRADLAGAYLAGADLAGALGLLSKPITPLQILGTAHAIIVREDGHVTIGCEHHPLEWWEAAGEAVGRGAGYTNAQIAEYRAHVASCRAWMQAYGVIDVLKKEEVKA